MTTEHSSAISRPRRSRSKTGCLICRLRRKRCDENKPICDACGRLSLCCSWPDPNEFAWRIRMGLSTHTENSPLTPTEAAAIPQTSIPRVRPGTFPEMNEASVSLFQLYIEQTTPSIVCVPEQCRDPLIYEVVPLAFQDPLVMEAVLSVGGLPLLQGQGENNGLELRRLQHYARALKRLKFELAAWKAESTEHSVRLLLVTVLLCHHEVLRGNKTGAFRYHLRACRQFARSVAAMDLNRDDQDLVEALLELYSYFELSSSIHLSESFESLQLPMEAALGVLAALRRYPNFGVVFGSASSLYELIPDIRQLAIDRRQQVVHDIDKRTEETFEALRQRLFRSASDSEAQSFPPAGDAKFGRCRAAAHHIVRQSLQLFLYSAYFRDNSLLRRLAHPIVDEAIAMFDEIAYNRWRNPIYWPRVVIASYACTKEQQAAILIHFEPDIAVTARAHEVLRWLWTSEDDDFGLTGLAKVIEDHGASYCFG